MTLQTLQRRSPGWFLSTVTILLAIAPQHLGASGISGNYIVGQWGSPIFDGCLVDAVDRSSLTCANTSASAVYSISNASTTGGPLAASTIMEGANATPVPGVPPADSLTFTGGTIPATHESIPFVIGSISFTNGTSESGSQIYGATLNLFASNGNVVQFIGSELVQFNATLNTGTAAQNADYLTFSGLAGQSFEVYEGATATGALNGEVIGDPQVFLTSVTLDPGQSASAFIGADPALPTNTPEPGSLAMLGSGVFGLWTLRRRRGTRIP